MSDQTTELFSQPTSSDAPVQDPAPVAPPSDPYGTLLQGITTDDGRQKYGTVSDALTSIPHKEKHIATLEAEHKVYQDEIANLKAQLEAAKTLQVPQTNTATGNTQTGTPSTAIDVDALTQQVTAKLSAQEQQRAAAKRVEEFKNKLVTTYGEKAKDVYTSKLQESGLSEQFIMQAVQQNPDVAWNFLGLNKQTVNNTTVPAGTRNTQANVTQQPTQAPSFRPAGQYRPGSKLAAIRAELEAAGKI